MSKQKFSASERESLWLAHSKKCAYTGELIDVNNFHIDHIVPENLIDQPNELKKVKAELKLDDDFDLKGFENLLPCKPSANLKKGEMIFNKPRIHFFLAIALSKKKIVENNLEKVKKRNIKGKAIVLLLQFLQNGDLSVEEVTKIIEENKNPEEIFKLIESMKFADSTELRSVKKADIEELRKKQIRLGLNDHVKGITLINDDNKAIFIENCKEYDSACQDGYYALINSDIKMSVLFKHQCGLLSCLKIAKIPKISFIDEPKVGIMDLDLLPFSLFPSIGEYTDEVNSSVTYQQKVDDGTLTIRYLKQNTLKIEQTKGGMGQLIIEVGRADFNGDGLEDILLYEFCYATHGTLSDGGVLILSRKFINSKFECS